MEAAWTWTPAAGPVPTGLLEDARLISALVVDEAFTSARERVKHVARRGMMRSGWSVIKTCVRSLKYAMFVMLHPRKSAAEMMAHVVQTNAGGRIDARNIGEIVNSAGCVFCRRASVHR